MQNGTWSNLINAQHQQSIKSTRRKSREKYFGGNNKTKNSHLQQLRPQGEIKSPYIHTQRKSTNTKIKTHAKSCEKLSCDWVKIYSRQSSPPPSLHQLKCSGSQDSFTVDPYCNSGGINSGGQWPIPNCGGQMCHHGPGPGNSMPMTMSHLPMLGHGPSMTSLHGPLPPPPLCNPCSSQPNNFNSVPLPGPSRWGPRTSCPVHSPFRARIPNGTICSGHQVKEKFPCHFQDLLPLRWAFSLGEIIGMGKKKGKRIAPDNRLYRLPFASTWRMTGYSNGYDDDNFVVHCVFNAAIESIVDVNLYLLLWTTSWIVFINLTKEFLVSKLFTAHEKFKNLIETLILSIKTN